MPTSPMTGSDQEALQLSLGMGAAHNNRRLFSDHYLENLLSLDERWLSALPAAEAFLSWIQERYAKERQQLVQYKESQLEEHW